VELGIGARLRRTLLVGAHASVFAAEGTSLTASGEVHRSLRITSITALATWFPVGDGPFVRFGAGPTSAVVRSEPFPGGPENRADTRGFTLTAGAGYALRIARRFDLTGAVDASGHSFWSADAAAPDTATLWAVRVGARWQ
jgi:hypothetical protein